MSDDELVKMAMEARLRAWGACRQVLAEFNPSNKIVTVTMAAARENVGLKDLLPRNNQGILESF